MSRWSVATLTSSGDIVNGSTSTFPERGGVWNGTMTAIPPKDKQLKCPPTWDGWQCWAEGGWPGQTMYHNCPSYIFFNTMTSLCGGKYYGTYVDQTHRHLQHFFYRNRGRCLFPLRENKYRMMVQLQWWRRLYGLSEASPT